MQTSRTATPSLKRLARRALRRSAALARRGLRRAYQRAYRRLLSAGLVTSPAEKAMRARVLRGRAAAARPKARVNRKKVVSDYQSGVPVRTIAALHGISTSTMYRILRESGVGRTRASRA